MATTPIDTPQRDIGLFLIRVMVGIIFFFEGLQKWVFPHEYGEGRFEALGLPLPEITGYIVGSVEVTCSVLILLGLYVRYAAVPLFIVVMCALGLVKIPLWLDEGFWVAMRAAEVDICMLLATLFLIIKAKPAVKTEEVYVSV